MITGLRSFVLAVTLLIAGTTLGACYLCTDASDQQSPDAYVGIRGTLYSSGTVCSSAVCDHGIEGDLEATNLDTGVAHGASADATGDFEIALAPGRYQLHITVGGNVPFDAGTFEVGTTGWYVTKVFADQWERHVLALHFAVDVSAARQTEILDLENLTVLETTADGAVRVTMRSGSELDLSQSLPGRYAGEILAVELNNYDCGAAFDGAWVHSTGSSGSSGGHHHGD
jgi:hypothetical protein